MEGRRGGRGIAFIVLALAIAAILASPGAASASERCSLGPAKLVDGQRRLALLIAVGKYLDPNISGLDGPVNDANKFRELLSGSGGYGFPDENVCMLTDEDATHAAVEAAFQKALLDRVADKKDVVVIYFAGHGSQANDDNGDEADGKDETLILRDSRTEGRGDLIDDRVNDWLKRLDEKTPNITLILDSCNSGSAARGEFKSRWSEPAKGVSERVAGGDAIDWTPALLPGLNVLSAATDGTSAMELDGAGLFTQALAEILSDSPRLTYAQIARRIPPLLRAAGTPQIAYVQGNLDSFVFQNTSRNAPISWSVRSVSPADGSMPVRVELAGPPLPGMGPNAELRIFDGALQGEELTDLAKAKGLAVVESSTALNATAMVARASGAPALAEGDVALLVRPSDDYQALTFSLRPEAEAGGIPSGLAQTLRQAVSADGRLKGLVTLSNQGELEASLDDKGSLILRGPANDLRNVIPPTTPNKQAQLLTRILASHARQRVFLRLRGEGGEDFTDQETLQVQIVPESAQSACAAGTWVQAPPNSEQIIPECYQTHIKVTVDAQAPYPLLVGGLVMSADGSIIGFPSDGRLELVPAGSTHAFRAGKERLVAISPYDVQDQILVFGTQENNPVKWSDLTQTVRSAPDRSAGTLHRTLDRYISGKRGLLSAVDGDDTTWTMTSIPIRVSQRPGSPGGAEACKPQICEPPKQPSITEPKEEPKP